MMATATPADRHRGAHARGQCHDESSFKSRFNQWAQFFLTDIPQGPSAYLNATYINFGRSQHSCITNNCLERAMMVYGVRRDDYDPTSISGSCRNIRRS